MTMRSIVILANEGVIVIPAKAGIQACVGMVAKILIPAYAGMTAKKE